MQLENGEGFPAAAPGALPLESFETLLSKEIERSRRYYRGFGLMRLLPLTPGQAESVDSTYGAGADVPPVWLDVVPRLMRRADVVARAPEGGLYILLPETPASGMPAVSRRLAEALSETERTASEPAVVPLISEAAYPRDGETTGDLLGALEAIA